MLRLFITAIFVSYIVDYAVPWTSWLGMFAFVAILFFIFYSSTLEKQSERMERNFTNNLEAREKMKKQH